MPIYEYQCDGCSYKFEIKQSIKDDPLSTCERCGHSVRRLISSPGILFKGSGWYVTDYSDKLKPPSGTSGSGGDSGGGTSTGDKKPSAAPAPSSSTASTPATAPTSSTTSSSSTATTPSTTK